jgi:hypothetical protein
VKKEIREMLPKPFGLDQNIRGVDAEAQELEA